MTKPVASVLWFSITGEDPSQRIVHSLREGEVVRIGRAPKQGWPIPWDMQISREHADLSWKGQHLSVACLPTARNPIVHRNQCVTNLLVAPGDSFQIGQTTFHLADSSSVKVQSPSGVQVDFDTEVGMVLEERAYSPEDLNRVAFRNAEQQLEVLTKLPQLIQSANSDEELGALLSQLLLEAIPHADAVAVAHYDQTKLPDDSAIDEFPKPLTLRLETRDDFRGRFRPSRRLTLKALRQQSAALHIWGENQTSEQFTLDKELGWAFCVPLRGESCQGWCLYVSGKGSPSGAMLVTESDLTGDLRFVELVAQFIAAVRQIRLLQEQKTQLSSFFSPAVIESVTGREGSKALAPAEREITVLFCDVRGFSRKSEMLHDDLLKLLQSASAALGVMASGILERDGAIADFQGDAALGFWGWPVELEEGPIPACTAALAIYREFTTAVSQSGSLLAGFSVGIGISHGRALAGQIGTDRQSKVGVFGPVVNQGARLEGLTKQFGVPICIDETTAQFARSLISPSVARVRTLARLRPAGMDAPLTVSALLPPVDEFPELTDQMIADHDEAAEAVIEGRWKEARALLEGLPDNDGPKRFLLRHMSRLGDTPPKDWDGAFSLKGK